MCMCACLSVYAPYAASTLRGQKIGWIPGAGVTGCCERPYTSQESHSLEPPPLRRIVNFKGKMVASYWGALAEATQ